MRKIRHHLLPYKILLTRKSWNILFAVFALVIVVPSFSYYFISNNKKVAEIKTDTYQTKEEQDVYVRFEMEAYDSITKNYWYKMNNDEMAMLFQLSLQKASTSITIPTPITKDRKGVAGMMFTVFSNIKDAQLKKELAVNTLIVAMYNLQPVGRNGRALPFRRYSSYTNSFW